jgi:hypothetical protein
MFYGTVKTTIVPRETFYPVKAEAKPSSVRMDHTVYRNYHVGSVIIKGSLLYTLTLQPPEITSTLRRQRTPSPAVLPRTGHLML